MTQSRVFQFILAVTAATVFSMGSADAQGAPRDTALVDTIRPRLLSAVKVSGRIDDLVGVASSASQGRIGRQDLRARPMTRDGELLETIPGMIVTQHSGDGKANQYFVRGFNLDHGTDFLTRVEGMPVNLPSHAHGQGWTDLNFLIPELVDHLDYSLGVYNPEIGDFGSAGSANFHLLRSLPRPFAVAGSGGNGLRRIAVGASRRAFRGELLSGLELKAYDGPWEQPQSLRKVSALSRYSIATGQSLFSILGMAYTSRWNSNDQIPARAVSAGTIGRFGQVDPSDGGNTSRYSLSATMTRIGKSSVDKANLYAIHSALELYSNFTFFLDDSINGDQFSQHDSRLILGSDVSRERTLSAAGISHDVKLGLQARSDFISPAGLYRTTKRERLRTVREDSVRQISSGVFLSTTSHWRPWLRTVLGQRLDLYDFRVQSSRPENSGHRTALIASPKASLIVTPGAGSEIYVSGGLGFHSNDARGTTINTDPVSGEAATAVDPLVRSRGAEVGLRVNPVSRMRVTLAVWALGLNSELLFTGDGGTTEPSAESRRSGVTIATFYRPAGMLSMDADVSFARARFTGVGDAADRIPGALESVIAAGITYAPRHGIAGAVRLRRFGAYPLNEDNSLRAESSTLVNADLGYGYRKGVRVRAAVLNLLNTAANDIQYGYVSRLRGEPSQGVEDIHFHPVEPRQLRFSLEFGL